jgi:hypothetical protein
MASATDQRLAKLLRASEEAGKTVAEAIVGPDGIRLIYAEPKVGEATRADLIDWRRPRG